MGLSKIFPCQKRRREKQKAQQQATSEAKKDAAGGAPPKLPPVADVSNNTTGCTFERGAGIKSARNTGLIISQRIWNRAYDELAEDKATAQLVEAYVKVVPKATNPDDDSIEPDGGHTDKLQAQMKDPVQRQAAMKDAVKAGQAKIAKSSKVTNGVGNVASFVLKFKGVIDLAVQSNPQAALPWAGVCIGLQFLLNPAQASQSNLNGIAHVITRMNWYCSLTEHVLNKDNVEVGTRSYQAVLDELEGRVVALYKALLVYQMKSVCSYYTNQGWVWIRNIINLDNWNGELQGVQDAEAALKSDTDQYNAEQTKSLLSELVTQGKEDQKALGDFHRTLRKYIADQKSMRMDDQDNACLRDLVVVEPQSDMETIQGKNDKLLREAYDWILRTKEYQAITDWSGKASSKVLWVNGPAGTGKTMLMIGIISEISDLPSNLAPGLSYFFCQALQKNRNSPMDALRSLMWMLLIQQPNLIWRVREKHKTTGAGLFNSDDQFWSLAQVFKEMLADPQLLPTYFLLDALDECQDGRPGVHELLNLISESIEITSKNSGAKVKWILSSRPEVDVYNKFKNRHSPGTVVELDVQASIEPVNAYVEHKLSDMGRDFGYPQDILDQMSIEIRERAQNTFLWVALVFKDLIDDNVAEYDAVDRVRSSPSSLYSMYDRIMGKIEQGSANDEKFCKDVLAAACLVYRPLTYAQLHVLAGLPKRVRPELIVRKCGSFVTVRDGVVYLLHNSTKEYLHLYFNSGSREGEIGQIHAHLARRSIDAMSEVLVRNIYKLDPSSEASDITVSEKDAPAAVHYSCEFWIDHLCEAGNLGVKRDNQLSDDGPAFAFLKEHFLHWIESLALIHKASRAVSLLRKLLLNVEDIPSESHQFFAFLKDAERFSLRNLSIIEKAPLQTYGAALTFSPTKSEIHTRYWKDRLPFIGNITGMRENWDPCLQTQAAESGLEGVTFSPDGKLYASFSSFNKGIVQLWDPETGSCTQTLTTDDRNVHCVAFSPDSKVLASLASGILQLWNSSTGACRGTWKLLDDEGMMRSFRTDASSSLAFSRDGDVLAIAIDDTVQLWDIDAEACKKTLHGHSKAVMTVAFSPDGKTLASSSSDGTVKLWDFTVGTCQHTLDEGNDPFAVLFSPDGNKLACTSVNWTMTFWDMPSGTYTHSFSPELSIKAAAFLSGSEIAVASTSGKIHVLDVATGARKQTFNHGGSPLAVSVSPSKSLIVSASDEGLLRAWDAASTSEESLVGHGQAIFAVQLSPDAKTLATASMDKTVKLWSTDRICTQMLDGHTDMVVTISFSPDGKTIASGSLDRTARIWEVATGACIYTLGPFGEEGVSAVSFSEDGAVLATANRDGEVKLWDPKTGNCKQTLENDRDYMKPIFAVTLSRGCQMALMGTMGSGAQIYDVSTGTRTHNLLPGYAVSFVAFSPDSKTCALGSGARGVELFDTATGTHQQNIKSRVYGYGLSFSDDGNYLKTSQGPHKLTSGVVAESPDPELSRSILYLDGDGEWLFRGDKKLLRIPPEYRGRWTALGQNTIVLSNISGQVIFLELN